jgi:hypothetical protein
MSTPRRTDREVAIDYASIDSTDRLAQSAGLGVDTLEIVVRIARRDEPRINSGLHLIDWFGICDEDDDFDSFYGADYPWD